MYAEIERDAGRLARLLLEAARLQPGDILVVGCSTSEIAGHDIGSYSSEELGRAVFAGIYPAAQACGVFLAAQCCEHLNRALVLEQRALGPHGLERVNVVPKPKAGGSFASAAWAALPSPAAVEAVRARAGIDIGGTLIGMHLCPVAVPVRLPVRTLGQAAVICARTRPKYIGGARAQYDEGLL